MLKKKFVLWITGLPASGKTTLAKALKNVLDSKFDKIYHLDGDEVRVKSKKSLGFTKQDRDKNISLAIDLAKKYQDKGYLVIASFISPYKYHREWGRDSLKNFIEIFTDSPIEICELRDLKGLYKKARTGEVAFFTGITDRYDVPKNSDIHLETHKESVDDCVNKVIKYLSDNDFI